MKTSDATKPFSDVRRLRFEGVGKHSLHGRTARARFAHETSREAMLKLSGNDSIPPNRRFERKQRMLLTAVETIACHAPNSSLQKRGAWTSVVEVLENHCTTPPKVRKLANGIDQLKYTLEPLVEHIVRDAAPTRTQKRSRRLRVRKDAIYELHARKGQHHRHPRLFATLSETAPSEIVGEPLVPKTLGGSSGRHGKAALVRNNNPFACFDVDAAGGAGHRKAYLEVDLGHEMLITEVSTQGRHPPTRIFPEVRHERREARASARRYALAYRVNDRSASSFDHPIESTMPAGLDGWTYYVEGRPDWVLSRDGPYNGPYWNVLSLGRRTHRRTPQRCEDELKRLAFQPDPDHNPDHKPNPDSDPKLQAHPRWEEELQWVTKYELLARRDGSRSGGWFSVGVFAANCDATSEVVHRLTGLRGGLHARYLRCVPLDAPHGGALRIGVYGAAAVGTFLAAGDAQRSPSAAARAGGADCTYCAVAEGAGTHGGSGGVPETIEYTLARARSATVRHAPDGRGLSGWAAWARRHGYRYGEGSLSRPHRRQQIWRDAGGSGVTPWRLDGAAKRHAIELASSTR